MFMYSSDAATHTRARAVIVKPLILVRAIKQGPAVLW